MLGVASRRGYWVRQGGLGRVLCHHSRIVLDDNHGDLGPLRRPLGQSPEMERGSEGSRSDTRQETAKIEELIAKRAEAKKAKDFATADAIRDELAAMGITIKDTRQGVQWFRG